MEEKADSRAIKNEEVMVPEKDWIWNGHAGHLIVGSQCEFHLATRVGDYIISTVGEYNAKGITKADGNGVYAPYTSVGYNRLFETFVFEAEGIGYGEPKSWSEIDSLPANDHDTATRNHMSFCREYAEKQ